MLKELSGYGEGMVRSGGSLKLWGVVAEEVD